MNSSGKSTKNWNNFVLFYDSSPEATVPFKLHFRRKMAIKRDSGLFENRKWYSFLFLLATFGELSGRQWDTVVVSDTAAFESNIKVDIRMIISATVFMTLG